MEGACEYREYCYEDDAQFITSDGVLLCAHHIQWHIRTVMNFQPVTVRLRHYVAGRPARKRAGRKAGPKPTK